MQIHGVNGSGPYIDAQALIGTAAGRWFNTDQQRVVSVSVELSLAAGTVTGNFYAEYTADPENVHGISRVLLPSGSLHTNLAGAALASDGTSVVVTAATSGSFSVSLANPGSGRFRFVWVRASGAGAAPNLVSAWASYQKE